jgi:hypothetical protein
MTALLIEPARGLTAALGEELRRHKGEQLSRQALRDLVRVADTLAGVLLSAWASVRERLAAEGFEGRDLAQMCQILLDGIDDSLAGFEQLVEMAKESGLTPEAAGLPDLEARLPALREARPRVAEVLGVATRPPRPVDEARLAGARAALERGEFVTADDEYLARLRAGGDF